MKIFRPVLGLGGDLLLDRLLDKLARRFLLTGAPPRPFLGGDRESLDLEFRDLELWFFLDGSLANGLGERLDEKRLPPLPPPPLLIGDLDLDLDLDIILPPRPLPFPKGDLLLDLLLENLPPPPLLKTGDLDLDNDLLLNSLLILMPKPGEGDLLNLGGDLESKRPPNLGGEGERRGRLGGDRLNRL